MFRGKISVKLRLNSHLDRLVSEEGMASHAWSVLRDAIAFPSERLPLFACRTTGRRSYWLAFSWSYYEQGNGGKGVRDFKDEEAERSCRNILDLR